MLTNASKLWMESNLDKPEEPKPVARFIEQAKD